MAIAAFQTPAPPATSAASSTVKPHASKLVAYRQSYKEVVDHVPATDESQRLADRPQAPANTTTTTNLKTDTLQPPLRVTQSLGASSSAPPPPKSKRKPTRIRSSSDCFTSPVRVTFTPSTPAVYRSKTSFLGHKLPSASDLVDLPPSPPPYTPHPDPVPSAFYPPTTRGTPPMPVSSDTEDDRDDDDDMLYTAGSTSSHAAKHSAQSLRSRIFGLASIHASATRVRDRPISTTPGALCAGETETETDEPSRHLPTARIVHSSGPIVPPTTLAQRLTPLLFEFARLLSIVPAVFGTLYNLYHIYNPPPYDIIPNTRPPPQRTDYFISALWAILTGYQCLALATGLLTRWRLYYPPLSTLVRLLALQGICWPATHLTLTILEHGKRPAITWAVIGTTTCMSRSVQIWVTSNLWWERAHPHHHRSAVPSANGSSTGLSALGVSAGTVSAGIVPGGGVGVGVGNGGGGGVGSTCLPASASATTLSALLAPPPVPVSAEAAEENRRGYWKRWGGGGKWGGRRWDWREVGVKCVLPAGVVYFVMAWADQLRREWETFPPAASPAGVC